MKISKLMLSLMITGSSLGTAAAQEISLLQQPASASDNSAGLNSRKHIGDSSVVTADETGAVGRRKAHLGDYDLAPAAASWTPAVPASFALGAGGNCDTGCTPSCGLETACGPTGPSCGLEACGSGCGTGRGLGLGDPCGCGPSVFFSSETLLWWGQARSAPALLTTSAQNVLPVAGNAGVTTVVGGVDGISTGLLPGYRLTGGFYFGPEKRVGVSGRVFGLLRDTQTFTAASGANGVQSVGLPFFNTQIAAEDAYLVAFNNGLPVASGSATVTTRNDLVAVEPSLRFLMGRSSDHKVELIGGYTFLRMKDNLNIASTSRDLFTGNLIPDNTVFRTVDNFSATNTFHGGHIGLESKINRRRVSLGTLAKVSIGNFTQTTSTTGSTTIAPPPGTVPGAPFAGGLYTQQSNIHNFTREKFGFIPELGVNGGFNLNSNIQLTAGYSFLYLSNVALAGNQVDRNIDFTQAQGGPLGTQPSGAYRDGSTWYQGLNLGVNMTY